MPEGASAGATWISWQLALPLMSGGALRTKLALRLCTHDTATSAIWLEAVERSMRDHLVRVANGRVVNLTVPRKLILGEPQITMTAGVHGAVCLATTLYRWSDVIIDIATGVEGRVAPRPSEPELNPRALK